MRDTALSSPHTIEMPVRNLFYPYLVCVFSLVFLLILHLLHYDFARLPQQPGNIVILMVFLELPHIVASHIMLADREYASFYWPKLQQRYIVATVAMTAIWFSLGQTGFFAAYFIWTVYHVLKQQIGIGRIMNRQPNKLYEIWGYVLITGSLILAAVTGYFRVGLGDSAHWLTFLTYGFALLICGLGYLVSRQLKQSLGKWYVFANTAMYISVLICFILGAPFFVIFIPRIIHDVTAYMLYINHDVNRNATTRKNILYRGVWFIPVWAATLILSIVFGGLVTFAIVPFAYQIAIALTISHYTLESVVWRGTSLHRKSLRLSF